MDTTMRIQTLAVHAGYQSDPTTRSAAVPLYQTTSYTFDNAQHGADLFDLKVAGHIYTRIMNPTTDVLEQRVAALEGGIGALAMASGMAAITAAIQTIAETGDNIISASTLYRGDLQPVCPHLPAARHRSALCRPARPGQLRQPDRRAHQGRVLQIHRQPAGQRDRHPRPGRRGPRCGRAADRGQHRTQPLPVPPVRAWRGHRRPRPDQVHERPRQQHRRRHGR